VACFVSSCSRRGRASTVSASRWSWAGLSPNSGSSDGSGVVETVQLD
jgi:hypothetical protein